MQKESTTCKRKVLAYLVRLLYILPILFLYKNYGGAQLKSSFWIQTILLLSYAFSSLVWDYLNYGIIDLDDMIILTGFNAVVMIAVFAYSHPVSGFLISAFCLFEAFLFIYSIDVNKIRSLRASIFTAKEKTEPDNDESENESFADAETDTEVDVDAQVAADETDKTDEFQETDSSNIYDDFDPRFLDA